MCGCGGGGDSRSLRSFARRLRCGTSILIKIADSIVRKMFFPGSFAAFIYFCSWNDDKDKQSGESESNLLVWYLRP